MCAISRSIGWSFRRLWLIDPSFLVVEFYNIYTQHFKEVFGGKNGQEMIAALEKRLEELQSTDPEIVFYKQNYNSEIDQQFIPAIVTPFLKRVDTMVIFVIFVIIQLK